MTSYDHETKTADVRPVMKKYTQSGREKRRGIIPGLKVSFPQGGGFSIVWPLQKGDRVVIDVLTVPHKKFLEEGLEGESPSKFTRFDMGSSLVFAGVKPINDSLNNGGPDKMEIGQENGGVKITLNRDGDATINVPDGKKVNIGDSTADKALAMAESVASRLNDFKDTYDKHGHVENSSGTTPPAVTGPPRDDGPGVLERAFTSTNADELSAKHAEDNKGDNAL